MKQFESIVRREGSPSVASDKTVPLVLIIDDDAAIRRSLSELMMSVGIDCIGFASARSFLEAVLPDRAGCLILDVRMPEVSGLELQCQLRSDGYTKPVVFVTGYGDVELAVRAMRAGAIDFLTKPFRAQTLLDAVNVAIEKDVSLRAEAKAIKGHVDRLSTLTPRQRQVLHYVALGKLNKQIAFELGITEQTVKVHRGSVKRKLQAASVGEVVRAWNALPIDVRNTCSLNCAGHAS
ncbi:response regulator transcription factor [Reyranella soli]|uniref:DNA-binding response regulator n=1 Tax=Reyranella soli TaxID=1230389 RepID=A0A512NLA6_9HYPH|nr:response regulator transcription factor [Reyranella soli]GEP59728.1 DNA-binding response regulator [Reyranella soli]